MENIAAWFSGSNVGGYHTLMHCMQGDMLWIIAVCTLSITVLAGYFVIAWFWRRSEKTAGDSTSVHQLRLLRWIFILCGICGYGYVLLETVWPAWRLDAALLAVLATVTWRYAYRARGLGVVYADLKRLKELEEGIRSVADPLCDPDRTRTLEGDMRLLRAAVARLSNDDDAMPGGWKHASDA